MRFNKPENENYCATIVKIKNIIDLVGCDNIKHTNIFGNLAIVSNNVKVGDVGVFFPPETELSVEFLKNNNLYRHNDLNANILQKGYIDDSGRIRTIKLRGNISMGLFLPLSCFSYLNIKESEFSIGDCFDTINSVLICKKYVVYRKSSTRSGNVKNNKKPKVSKLVDNQFKFHINTSSLGKNIEKVKPTDIISVTLKMHGTSGISGNIICKRKLSLFEKILLKCGIKIETTKYENIYSSRKIIKNDDINMDNLDLYGIDIWGIANNRLKEFIDNSMTLYYEIVGYLPTGKGIQSKYDYGCEANDFQIYIYRITSTNNKGRVYEFSAKQVQNWCQENGLKAVPELYYGRAIDLFNELKMRHTKEENCIFEENFLELLDIEYNGKLSVYCKNKVPEEGIVLRIEKNTIECYKLKSKQFLEFETKELDKGEENIEDIS